MKVIKKIFGTYNILIWRLKSTLLKTIGSKVGKNVKYNSSVINQSNLNGLSIGNDTWIGSGATINALNGISIGKDVLISDYCGIISTDHEYKYIDTPIRKQGYTTGKKYKIIIGDGVWIGLNVIIMKGVTIGENSIIGAGSVVTKNIEKNSIYAGVPAKFIKKRK